MIKEKFKDAFKIKKGENNKRAIENLVVLGILLIITVVAINYILSGNNKKHKTITNSQSKTLATEDVKEVTTSNESMENKLENILSKIKGVGNVKVLVTYSQTNQIIPMYNEDSSTSTTEEKDSGGGTRTVNENSSKKDIIYEEKNGVKTPITQSIINPTIEGAIITAQGATNADVKTNIVQAVEAVTGLATYKIQVFEMD